MRCSQEVADWSWGWEQVGQSIGTEEARTSKAQGFPCRSEDSSLLHPVMERQG